MGALLFLCLSLFSASALSYTSTKVTGGDYFGASVSVYGDTVLVEESGPVHIFDCSSFPCQRQDTLNATGSQYLVAMTFWENLVAVTAPSESKTDSAAVYIYDCSSFPCTLGGKIQPPNLTFRDEFGSSLSISSKIMVVGAPGNIEAAFVYDCSSFPCVEVDRLKATDPDSLSFGAAVSISGKMVVCGAPFGSTEAAFLFDCSSFPCIQKAKILSPDGVLDQEFGQSVAISDNLVFVGAVKYYDDGAISGAVYVFDCSSFPCVHQEKLVPTYNITQNGFGAVISASNSRVVIGEVFMDEYGTEKSGTAYLYDCSSHPCVQLARLTPENSPISGFGYSVSISDSLMVVGDPVVHSATVFSIGLPNSSNRMIPSSISLILILTVLLGLFL